MDLTFIYVNVTIPFITVYYFPSNSIIPIAVLISTKHCSNVTTEPSYYTSTI